MEKSKSPYANATVLGPKVPKKHFVLVHTACHGAWSWYKIVAMVRSSGNNVTTLDLDVSGINSIQALEIPHLSDYLSPLMEFMASLPDDEKVILVSHSFGGLVISKAMKTFPEKISVAVFLSALMPAPNINATTMYTKDLALATTLVRPFYLYSAEDISKEIVLSSKRYGSVRRVLIVAAENEYLKKEFQRLIIEKNPPDEMQEIEGFDHMAMMSKPQQLFTTLLSISNKYR